ncbi:hypothetical protein GOBAR_DD31336 [Gossypium barbadense]|nr:hypothetical protein GOBAR_DD31336 [Gossypium barbadense]
MCSFILQNDPPPLPRMLDPLFLESKKNTLAIVGIMITSGFFRSPAASHKLLEALCKSGNIPVAVRWSEQRTANTILALFANFIKKGLHPKTIYEDGEEEGNVILAVLNDSKQKGRLHPTTNDEDGEDEAKAFRLTALGFGSKIALLIKRVELPDEEVENIHKPKPQALENTRILAPQIGSQFWILAAFSFFKNDFLAEPKSTLCCILAYRRYCSFSILIKTLSSFLTSFTMSFLRKHHIFKLCSSIFQNDPPPHPRMLD